MGGVEIHSNGCEFEGLQQYEIQQHYETQSWAKFLKGRNVCCYRDGARWNACPNSISSHNTTSMVKISKYLQIPVGFLKTVDWQEPI